MSGLEAPAMPGSTIDVARIKVSGLSAEDGVLWLASIRERLVARVAVGSADRVDVKAAMATVILVYPHPVADVAPSPEGVWLVAGGGSEGRQCVLWSLAEGRELRRFDTPAGAGGGLAFYRERLWLTHRHNRRLLVLDPVRGTVERTITTEHEVFSPSVVRGALWLVEAKTGPFGRFGPASETSYFFTEFDVDAEAACRRLVVPVAPTAIASNGTRVWYAPRETAGVVELAHDALPPASR